MMRKNQHTFYILAACTVLLSGCARVLEEDLEEQMPTFRSKYICFVAASGDIATKSSPADAPVSFMTEEDWPVGTPTTKGNPTTAFSGNASITGYLYSGDWAGTETPWATLYDKSFSFNGSVLNAVTDPVPWVKAQSVNPKLRVYAYAPADFAATMSSSSAPGAPTLTYRVPSDVGDQKDLIVATGDALCANKTSVPLTFSHALTAVKFNVDFPCTVKRIVVSGVYDSGVYTIGGAWSGQAFSSTEPYPSYTIDFGAGISCNKGSSVTDGANTLILIPQTVPVGAEVVMTYNEGADDKYLTASIAGGEWAAGKRVTYNLSKSDPNYIYFDLAAGNITLNYSGGYKYSGYVYENTAGTPTLKQVSGTHNNNNEYYVYQSSTNSSSPNYRKGWTGTVNSDGKTPGEAGSMMDLPVYDEVMAPDGITKWSDYITNNPDSRAVSLAWDTRAAAAGRTCVTDKVITITGNGSVDFKVDMVLADCWSDHSGRLPINITKSRTYVTFRIKGDNHFNRVLHQNGGTYSGMTITSYDGDCSTKGSLTVTCPGDNPYPAGSGVGDRQSAMIGAFGIGMNPSNFTPLYFEGGTIYAANSTHLTTGSTGWGSCCVGGGNVSRGEVHINGGILTAVSHGTGPAIGGGAGWNNNAGPGDITITGGAVYAYQHGITTDSSLFPFPVSSTAIGGGSSFRSDAAEGRITITGGYVYAQSVGGVAIGGGSSSGAKGGDAIINISGGTVIAKSIPGIIRDFFTGAEYEVEAGTAIGGGNGGDERRMKIATSYDSYGTIANGGSATITISGGRIYTGSIGGGRPGFYVQNDVMIPRYLGSAVVSVTGGDIQGQFIMAAGAATTPSFTMTGGTINNKGLLASDGFYKVRENGGAVYIGSGSNPGSFTMESGIIQNCSAINGGVVYQEDGSCTINGGSILNSTASAKGGAVYIAGAANPTFTMSSGEISGCRANSDGGAVYLEGGLVTIDNGTIRRNKALGGSGGGICINKGSFTMRDGAINGNYADLNGGGVFISSVDTDVTATVSGGTITENTSEKWGGGLCILPGGSNAAIVTLGATGRDEYTGLLSNPDISGNRSKFAGGGVYTAGANAHITINSGKINGNQVTAYVANENVANEGGMVTLLDGDVTHQVVTFHANGEAVSATAYFGTELEGTGPTTKIQKIVTSTNSKLVAPTVYYCAGFHFNGWNSRPDGLGETYTNGQVMNITENVDLYIQWEID